LRGEEIKSHDLFSRLLSKKTITGEDETEDSELRYLQVIRQIRDNDPDTFEKIKRLPKKARTARTASHSPYPTLLTYFRKGKLQKFFLADAPTSGELDFLTAAKWFEVKKEKPRVSIGKDFYPLLDKNKKAFEQATSEEGQEFAGKGGRDSTAQILRILKVNEIRKYKGFTEEDEDYILRLVRLLEEGGLPKQTAKTVLKSLDQELKNGINPLRIIVLLRTNIAQEFFRETMAETAAQTAGPREVILSEFFVPLSDDHSGMETHG